MIFFLLIFRCYFLVPLSFFFSDPFFSDNQQKNNANTVIHQNRGKGSHRATEPPLCILLVSLALLLFLFDTKFSVPSHRKGNHFFFFSPSPLAMFCCLFFLIVKCGNKKNSVKIRLSPAQCVCNISKKKLSP